MKSPESSGDASRSRLPPQLQQAIAAHEKGELQTAYPLYREFVAAHPDHPTALQLFGLLMSQLGQHQTAIALMQESLRLFPEQAEVANNLGNALSRCGRLAEALEKYEHAVRLQPRYTDALRNLGICHLKLQQGAEAKRQFEKCLEIQPDDAVACFGLGNAQRQLGDLDAAIRSFEKAVSLRPQYAEAQHNLAVCLRLKGRATEAVEHLDAARRSGLDRAELYHNLGNALIDAHEIDEAIEAYRQALQRDPLNTDTHRNLNSLLWQQDRLDDYLNSYRDALDRRPDAEPLRLAYAMALNQQEAFGDAERLLREGLERDSYSSELKSLLGYTLEGQGRWQEALQAHAHSTLLRGSTPNHRISYARALLACGRPDEALREAKQGAAQMPFNQRALAYLGLCWRMLGDSRDEYLNDYEKFVRVFDVPVPTPFVTAGEFNERLMSALDALHIARQHPAEQTLRGGTQTSGDLFDRPEPEIRALIESIRHCVRQYIDEMPFHAEHPLLVRKSADFNFAASWSVRLAPCGYHTMHVHPLGWISSAYYVQVPPEIMDSDAAGGGLKFGEPDIDIGNQGAARRVIQPAAGRLVLFPSYMWHGTVPFESAETRTTVAFDVVPGSQ
jgi:uncharacterized protein (TIGR02466 family)